MIMKTVQEVENLLREIDDRDNPIIKILSKDRRKGVKQLLDRWEKKINQAELAKEKFEEMTLFEKKYRSKGYQLIAGVDEVGRGPLAGPVVAAAVILPADFYLSGIDDSKKLSDKKREEYFRIINEQAIAIGMGMVEAEVIDEMNIYEATKKAMNIAISTLTKQPEVILIDAMKLDTPFLTESIIKGDAKSISIAAASIIAKVTRDRMMKDYSVQYPYYRFEQNMGYGTREHLEAINKYGITPLHRKSFAPIKDLNAN
ncbi:ribonuclease HII [Neobacillus sp. D3-1R]|uniref:ribonuclease HII n=1 Tax=Neobacillus sp. D3-1R TaxID=3445778 RepID=UPI003F9FC401